MSPSGLLAPSRCTLPVVPERLTSELVAVLDGLVGELGSVDGSEAAAYAIAEIRRRGGERVYPSLYRLDGDRLWLIAQAGYVGVYDGIGIDRGVMAAAVATGETQFVPDAREVPDYLHAQSGFVSEITVKDGTIVFNIETTEPLADGIVAPAEAFARELAGRLRADPGSIEPGPLAHMLGPMVAESEPEMIIAHTARIASLELGLEMCQVVVFGEPPVDTNWRTPETRWKPVPLGDLTDVIRAKGAYASWVGPGEAVGHDGGEAVVMPIHRRGSTIGGLVGVGEAITHGREVRQSLSAIATHTATCLDRHALEQRLRQSLEDRIRFVATVSHELRTQLTAISGFTALLMNDGIDDEIRSEALVTIKEGSDGLVEMIDDLLVFARADGGRLEVRVTDDVDLADVVDHACRVIAGQADVGGTSVVSSIEDGLHVRADAGRLRQVFVNVVGNAVKFSPGGEVRVSARPTGDQVTVEVVDDGKGIEPEVLATLFEPFTGNSVLDPDSGTGLGLVISRELARAMGGDLTIESRGSGAGATARLTLRRGTAAQGSAG